MHAELVEESVASLLLRQLRIPGRSQDDARLNRRWRVEARPVPRKGSEVAAVGEEESVRRRCGVVERHQVDVEEPPTVLELLLHQHYFCPDGFSAERVVAGVEEEVQSAALEGTGEHEVRNLGGPVFVYAWCGVLGDLDLDHLAVAPNCGASGNCDPSLARRGCAIRNIYTRHASLLG